MAALTLEFVQGAAVLSAALAGGFGGTEYLRRKRIRFVHEQRLKGASVPSGEVEDVQGQRFKTLHYAEQLSHSLTLQMQTAFSARLGLDFVKRWYVNHAPAAGSFVQAVTPEGFVEATLRLALACCLLFSLVGAVFSNELAFVGAVGGALFGGLAPRRALLAAAKLRAAELSRDLPEMLEVVALGLRSGLSFDRSMALYTGHFSTVLSLECSRAMRRWTMGLTSRENALRQLAQTYDSPLFSRVVEGVVRSLRFGSSMAGLLEQAASEARAEHRATIEERVAKVPVKMMVPTSALILPAMLLLVLGPVLLELIGG